MKKFGKGLLFIVVAAVIGIGTYVLGKFFGFIETKDLEKE